jgi:hypothetical protein
VDVGYFRAPLKKLAARERGVPGPVVACGR